MQSIQPLLKVLLQQSCVLERDAHRVAGAVARRECNGGRAKRNCLLSKCVHLVVQFRLVAMGRLAASHRLDRIEWDHVDFGSHAGACMGSRLPTIG